MRRSLAQVCPPLALLIKRPERLERRLNPSRRHARQDFRLTRWRFLALRIDQADCQAGLIRGDPECCSRGGAVLKGRESGD
jgi:hypothetical protein